MASDARIEVWCEDGAHERFVRRLLEKGLGVPRRRTDVQIAPRGRGAASAWVVRQYSEAVRPRERATRHHQQRLGFLVVLDGDQHGVAGRLRQLHGGSGDDRDVDAKIAILVPTWSVETWMLWLSGTQVDESRSHKHELSDRTRFKEALESAVAAWQKPRPDEQTHVPSLAHARVELGRLPGRS
jgi:hypothetical protein